MKRLWFDLGEIALCRRPNPDITQVWQDHGLGLLRTIMHRDGVMSDIVSLRNMLNWEEVQDVVRDYDMLLMNVRSYNFARAKQVASLFKLANPQGIVLVGGMHATLGLDEMKAEENFDYICQDAGENVLTDLARDPSGSPRVIQGQSARSMGDWPLIDRMLWPKLKGQGEIYPLELAVPSWGPGPTATILTSRVCPWRCAFCNESSYIQNMGRKSVEQVIDELNWLDKLYGPIGSVVIHDSLFFQNPKWLEEWAETYPRKARKTWPYWAAARTDLIRRWPELFVHVTKQTNWQTISLGLESGSARTLKTLNKECLVEDNIYAISLINQIGMALEQQGRIAPRIFSNVIFGTPGETREDILDTLRMVSLIRNPLVSPANYAPFPGSALGYQLIAEHKSQMSQCAHERTPGNRNVVGVDYDLVDTALRGGLNAEAQSTCLEWLNNILAGKKLEKLEGSRSPHYLYQFPLQNGKMRLSYGESEADALETMKLRLSPEEMSGLLAASAMKIHPSKLVQLAGTLG